MDIDVIPVAKPESKLRKSKITSFWKPVVPAEKEEMNQCDFQKLKDSHKDIIAQVAEEEQWRKARGRTQA